MTEDQLLEGRKILDEIKKHEEAIEVLDSGYISHIKGAINKKGGTMETVSYYIENGLKDTIKEYITNKINKLQEEFNNL